MTTLRAVSIVMTVFSCLGAAAAEQERLPRDLLQVGKRLSGSDSPERDGGGAYELVPVWADRSGATQEIHPGWLVHGDPVWTSVVLSPDGNRLAISKRDSEGRFDLWVKQLDTGPESRSLEVPGRANRQASVGIFAISRIVAR